MKKITGLFALCAAFAFTACSEKPAEVKKEVIVVPSPPVVIRDKPVVIREKPVVIIRDSVQKPTTITLDKNGVKVKTKKIDIILNKQQ